MAILNSTNRTKAEGYALLLEASETGHQEAKIKVAWAMLLGTNLPQNIEKARDLFIELASVGIADAHMVSEFSINFYICCFECNSTNLIF